MTDHAQFENELYEANKPNVFPSDSIWERAIVLLAATDAALATELQHAIIDLMIERDGAKAESDYFENETAEVLRSRPKARALVLACYKLLPLLERYEGQGEGGTTDFDVPVHGFKKALAEYQLPAPNP